jgi:hypothetical protein
MEYFKDTRAEKDKLHWSFGSTKTMVDKVFPEGFSADNSTLPDEAFKPENSFSNSYDLVYTGNQPFHEDNKVYYGYLTIEVNYTKESVEINVDSMRQLNQNFQTERQHSKVQFKCSNTPLFPLMEGVEWKITKILLNQKDKKTLPFHLFEETGRYLGNKVEKKDHNGLWYIYKELHSKLPLVADWAILAGCHTLNTNTDMEFAYLQQLERYSYQHSIQYIENFKARFGNHELALKGFMQKGYGITPIYYWTDKYGRLLIANYSLYALVYNPSPKLKNIINTQNI